MTDEMDEVAHDPIALPEMIASCLRVVSMVYRLAGVDLGGQGEENVPQAWASGDGWIAAVEKLHELKGQAGLTVGEVGDLLEAAYRMGAGFDDSVRVRPWSQAWSTVALHLHALVYQGENESGPENIRRLEGDWESSARKILEVS